ncbi:MAG: peptidoglycan-binding domain-containing protein [Candidatus Paceibacterota bacterium]
MSKLLKLKFLLGGMLVAFVFAVSAASALAYTHSVTLKQGSSGAQVVALQQALNVSPADGAFGPMTKAAVVAYQAANGLTADGVVGAMTGAKLAGAVVPPVTGNYPAGCSSAVGYSTTTGVKCDSVSTTYPAGCSSAVGYSTTTGVKCDSVVASYPAGCSSAVGYSSTTGTKCDGVVTTTPTGLTGGAGNLTSLTKLSTYNDEVLNEGVAEKVLAVEVKADNGSDLNLTSLKLKFLHASTGSYRMDNYISDVSVYMGSTKVGTLSTVNFTKSTTDNSYSANITLSGVVIKAGQKLTLAVEVTPIGNIDSTDQNSGGLNWTVSTVSLRYVDATGAILTDSTIVSEVIGFTSVVNSGDLALKLASGTGNPTTGVVELAESGTTVIPVLAFSLKATGGNMDVTKIRLSATSTGDTDGAGEMVSSWELFKDGVSVDVADADPTTATSWDYDGNAETTAGTVIFSDIAGLTLASGTTTNFTVKATMKAMATTSGAAIFDQADNLKLSFLNADLIDVDKVLVETTAGGDTIATGDRTGAVTGNIQTFYTKGMFATLVSGAGTRNVSADTATLTDTYTGSVTFDVTAIGEDIYLDKSSEHDPSIAGLPVVAGQGIEYYIAKGGSIADAAATGYTVTGMTDILTAEGVTTYDTTTDFVVKEGTTRRFKLTATVGLNTAGTDGDDYYQVKLASINWAAADATADKFYTINLTDFISPVSSSAISDYAL